MFRLCFLLSSLLKKQESTEDLVWRLAVPQTDLVLLEIDIHVYKVPPLGQQQSFDVGISILV